MYHTAETTYNAAKHSAKLTGVDKGSEVRSKTGGSDMDAAYSQTMSDGTMRGVAKSDEAVANQQTKAQADLRNMVESNLISQALTYQEATSKLALKGAEAMKGVI